MSELRDKMDQASGKAKETAGKATGDSELEGEGKGEQMKAQAREAVDDVKEKANDAVEKMKGMFKGGDGNK